jgi:hypothetical protein
MNFEHTASKTTRVFAVAQLRLDPLLFDHNCKPKPGFGRVTVTGSQL